MSWLESLDVIGVLTVDGGGDHARSHDETIVVVGHPADFQHEILRRKVQPTID